MEALIRVRLLGSKQPEGWSHPRVIFDPTLSQGECAGILCWGQFDNELATYRGVKAWYYPEPRNFSRARKRHFNEALQYIAPHEFLHHSNPEARFQMPVVTHYSPIQVFNGDNKKAEIIAIVTNFGGRLWWLRPGARFRNRFICSSGVSLYGDPVSWSCFRKRPWSRARAPLNYRGDWPSNWYKSEHVKKLSQYRFALCLENSFEPNYFTEKFVNAVRAFCVPIYRAHPSVRERVLRGACWIDPADHDFDVKKTFQAAYQCDFEGITNNNIEWLNSGAVKETDGFAVWSKIAEYFERRIRDGDKFEWKG